MVMQFAWLTNPFKFSKRSHLAIFCCYYGTVLLILEILPILLKKKRYVGYLTALICISHVMMTHLNIENCQIYCF